ncbi:ashwin [Antennarius striatus]|uniref:ashwin n=1 Tax=Antennarius striatus TaxID=241820 RepID=UPI0035B1F242
MAASSAQDGKAVSIPNVDLLLHPELLSQEFMQLILSEKRISTRGCCSRDRLSELFVRHVIPLPQRALPNTRWGKRMERTRGRQTPVSCDSPSNDHKRKRPLIVFDGTSSYTGPLKVKRTEGNTESTGITSRLKPPPAANLSNPIRTLSKNPSSSPLSSSSSSSFSSFSSLTVSTDSGTNLKRESNSSVEIKSPDTKKKIPRVTWP